MTSGYLIKENKNNGIELALGTSGVLFGAILPRAVRTKLPVPMTLALIGATGSIYYGRKLYQQLNGV